MATRRQAREWAFQMLFHLDANPVELDELFAGFRKESRASGRARDFAEALVRGVAANMREIDGMISRHAKHWRLSRMGSVERNVLRMAVYEMIHQRDTPPAVVINEAVDIAKYFGTDESGRFVNGILDTIRREAGGGSEGGRGPDERAADSERDAARDR